jgi:glycosyltransferase involved in cell wall biosynthesis
MKIIYIANSMMPSRSANSIQVMKTCEAFSKKGAEITLLIPLSLKSLFARIDLFDFYCIGKRFKIKKIFSLPRRGIAVFYLLSAAYTIFKKVDIIYTRQIEAAMLASLCRKRFVLEMHSDLIDRVDRLFYRWIYRSKFFLRLILISSYLKKMFLIYGFDKKKISVLPDGVDINIFVNKKTRKYKRIRVGYGGHLFKGRGIETIEELSVSMPNIDFYLWGGTDKLLDYWRKRTKDIKNIYFEGFVKNNILAAKLANCDVLVMPYQEKVAVFGNRGDTVKWMSPLKMFEYMATGRPIIASDLAAIREVLRDGYNAILVPCGDIEKWKTAVEVLVSNKRIASKIGWNARNDVETKYTWDIRTKKILGVL